MSKKIVVDDDDFYDDLFDKDILEIGEYSIWKDNIWGDYSIRKNGKRIYEVSAKNTKLDLKNKIKSLIRKDKLRKVLKKEK